MSAMLDLLDGLHASISIRRPDLTPSEVALCAIYSNLRGLYISLLDVPTTPSQTLSPLGTLGLIEGIKDSANWIEEKLLIPEMEKEVYNELGRPSGV